MLTSKLQKGLSVYLATIILAVILSIVFGLSAILLNQIKMMRGMGYSVTAYYAAETGVERALRDIIGKIPEGQSLGTPKDPQTSGDHEDFSYFETLSNGAKYDVRISCCRNSSCAAGFSCPSKFNLDRDTCYATAYCVKAIGDFKEVKRAIEVKIDYPP